MNWDTIQGNWKQFKGEIKRRWGKLTDDDMDQIQGNREKLIGRLQERYGYARTDAQKEVDEYFDKQSPFKQP